MSDDDEMQDTPRLCEACGGTGGALTTRAGESAEPCRWCSHGFQDHRQHVAWKRFRARMRSFSGTYNVLEETLHDVLRRLGGHHGSDAVQLSNEGTRLLDAWLNHEGDDEARRALNDEISGWIKRAIDYLSGKP